MRIWVVTALDAKGNFVDQRRIEANSQNQAESYALDWIQKVGGNMVLSKVEEVVKVK